MPITREQAITENLFHLTSSERRNSDGSCIRWRRNGKTKIWKTKPNAFKVPIKHGLRDFDYIDETDAKHYHVPSECTNR